MKTKVKLSDSPARIKFPVLFRYIGDNECKDEIVLASSYSKGTIIHSVVHQYPLGYIYESTKFGNPTEWERLDKEITLTFSPS